MKLNVTFRDGEPERIQSKRYGYVLFEMDGSSAVEKRRTGFITDTEMDDVVDEVESLPFVQAVKTAGGSGSR